MEKLLEQEALMEQQDPKVRSPPTPPPPHPHGLAPLRSQRGRGARRQICTQASRLPSGAGKRGRWICPSFLCSANSRKRCRGRAAFPGFSRSGTDVSGGCAVRRPDDELRGVRGGLPGSPWGWPRSWRASCEERGGRIPWREAAWVKTTRLAGRSALLPEPLHPSSHVDGCQPLPFVAGRASLPARPAGVGCVFQRNFVVFPEAF